MGLTRNFGGRWARRKDRIPGAALREHDGFETACVDSVFVVKFAAQRYQSIVKVFGGGPHRIRTRDIGSIGDSAAPSWLLTECPEVIFGAEDMGCEVCVFLNSRSSLVDSCDTSELHEIQSATAHVEWMEAGTRMLEKTVRGVVIRLRLVL